MAERKQRYALPPETGPEPEPQLSWLDRGGITDADVETRAIALAVVDSGAVVEWDALTESQRAYFRRKATDDIAWQRFTCGGGDIDESAR